MSDIAQEIKTNIVFNAQQAIRNATELYNALQKISTLDFNNLANAFAQVGNALKLAEKNSVNLGKAITQSSKAISSIEQKSEQSVDKHIIQLRNLGAQGDSILKEIESKKAAGKVFDVSDFESYRQKLINLADKFRDIAPIDLTPHIRQSLVETFTGAKTVAGFNPVEMLRNEQLQELVSKRNRLIQQMNPSDSKENISVQTADLRNINRDILNLCLQAGDAQKAIRLLNDAINDIGNSKAFSEARKQIKQLTSDATKFDKASAKQESSMESTANKMSKMIDDFLAKKNAGKPFTEKQLTDFRDKFYARGAELGKFTDSDHTPRLREMFAQLVTGIKTRNNFDVSKLLDIGKPELGTQNLLQQRQQLIKQMQDAYSRDRNADLSMDLAKLREINSELGKMYLNFRQLQQAKKIMEEAIAIAGNQSATFGLDKHYKNILKQLEDANARIKQYQFDTDFNGARGKVDKYYDRVKALVASANDRDQKLVGVEINQKAKQESNFERLERKLANDVAKIQFEKDSGKTFSSYDIDQRIQKLYGYATGMNNIIQGGKAFDGAKLQIFPVVDQIVADLKNGMKIVTGEQVRQQKEQAAKDKEIAAQKKAAAKEEDAEEKRRQASHKLRFDMEKKNEKELLDAGLKISGIMDKVRNLQSLMDAKLSRGELPTRTFVDSFERSKERYANDLFKFTNQDYRPFIEHFAPKYTGKTKEDDDQLKYAQRTQSGIDKAKAKEDEARRKAEQKARDAEFKQIEDAERNINRIRDAFHNANITENYLPQAKINEFNKSLKESISLLLSLGGNQIKPVLDSIVPKVPTVSKEANAARERTIELRHKLEKMEEQELQKHVGKINSTMAKVYKLRDEMNAFTETGEHPSQKTLNRFNRQRNEYIQTLTDHTGIDYRPYIDAILPKSPTQTKEMDKKAQADTKAMEADVKKIESAWKTVEDIRRKLNSAEMADKLFKTEQIEKFRHELEEARKALISFGGEHYGAIFDKLAPKLPIMTQEMANAQKAQYDTQNAINKSIARQKEKVQKEEERQRKNKEKEEQKARDAEFKAFNDHWKKYSAVKDKVDRLRAVADSKIKRDAVTEKDLADWAVKKDSFARQLTEITGYNWKPRLDELIPTTMKDTVERRKVLQEEANTRKALAEYEESQNQKRIKHLTDLEKLARQAAEIIAKIHDKKNEGGLFTESGINKDRRHLNNIIDDINRIANVDIRPLAMNEFNQAIAGVQYKTPKDKTNQVDNSLQAQLEAARRKAQECALALQKNNTIAGQLTFMRALKELRDLESQVEGVNRRLSQTFTLFNNIGELVGKRMTWYLGDYLAGMVYNLPIDAIEQFRELDQAMAGVQQVMPLIENNQAEINNEMSRFLEISHEYAQEIAGVVEAGQLWGRGYGKPEIGYQIHESLSDQLGAKGVTDAMIDYVAEAEAMKTTNELVAQSAILATVDNFSMMESVKGLEAILAAYGLRAKTAAEATLYAGRAVDIVTKVAHYGQISAQDLVRGIEATGAAAADAGMSLEFLSAMIETGSRNTGLSGSNIGNAIKAFTAAFDTPKAENALKEVGIDITYLAEDGKRKLKPLEDIFLEVSYAIENGDENMRALIRTLSGGRQQFSKMMAIFKDPTEVMRMWGEALDSAGFAEEQLKVQMETINAHVKQMKTEFTSLFQTFMRGGGKAGMIAVVDGITNALRFLEDHMTGIKTAMGAFLAMKFSSWAFGFIGAIKNMIIATRTFSNELQRAGVANSSIGAILKSGVKETFTRVFTIQTDNNFSSTQQMKNITEQLKNVENQETASKNANTATTSANTAAKASNTTATTANSTANVANSTSETANTAAKVGNTAATVANRNAQATKVVATEAATVATNALTAAELRQAAVTTIATAGVNLLIVAAIGAVAALGEYAFATETVGEKLDKAGKGTQKEADALDEEVSKLKQVVLARQNQIKYTDKAIEMYLESEKAIKQETEGSKEWQKHHERMAKLEVEIAKIFGREAMQRITESKDKREAYKLEKEVYEKTTAEKIARIRELNDKLALFYKNRAIEADKEAEIYKVQIDNFGKWTEAQLEGLGILESAWARYHQMMFNISQERVEDLKKTASELRKEIKELDPRGQYFDPYDRRSNTKEGRQAAIKKAPLFSEIETKLREYNLTMGKLEYFEKLSEEHRAAVIEGKTILPFEGLKSKINELQKTSLESNVKELESLSGLGISDEDFDEIYSGKRDINAPENKDGDDKSSKSKEIISYKDDILKSFGAIHLQAGVDLPVSLIYALASSISAEGDPVKLLTTMRTNNPLGVNSALMQEYYKDGQLGNIWDNSRAFAEFVKAHRNEMSDEEIIQLWLENVFPDISDEDIEARMKYLFGDNDNGEAAYLDSMYDFKKNLKQVHPPEKTLYNAQVQTRTNSTVMQPVYQQSPIGTQTLQVEYDPNFSDDENEMWAIANDIAIEAKKRFNIDIAPDLFYRQFYVETFAEGKPFNSLLARLDNNMGGLTRTSPNPDFYDDVGYEDGVLVHDITHKRKGMDAWWSYFHDRRNEFKESYLNDFLRHYHELSGLSITDVGEFIKWMREFGYIIDSDIAGYQGLYDVRVPQGRVLPSGSNPTQPIQTQYVQPVQSPSNVPTDHIVRDYFHKFSSVEGYDNWDANEVTDTIHFQPAMFEFLNALGKRLYEELGFRATITGGAEKGYHVEDGTYTHLNGYKVDIGNFDLPVGGSAYQIMQEVAEKYGVNIAHEPDHYDLQIKRSEPLSSIIQPLPQPSSQPIDVSSVLDPYRFKVFNQADPRWADLDYDYRNGGANSFAASACAPMALAMMISGYMENVDPVQVAKDLVNYHVYGEGTSGQGIIDVAKQYGIDLKETSNVDEIQQALQQGLGVVAAHGAGKFTKFGHVMLYAGLDENGDIILNNPNGGTQTSYSPDFVLNDLINSGGVAYIPQNIPIPQTATYNPSSYSTTPVQLDLSNGYTPQIGDVIYIDQSYQTLGEVIKEGIDGIITAIDESGEALVSVSEGEFQGENRLSDIQVLGEMKVFRSDSNQPTSIQYPVVNQGVMTENYWTANQSKIQTLRDLRLDSIGAYDKERQRQIGEYERERERIAHDRKIHGDSAELDEQEITNERKALRTIEIHKSILEDINKQLSEPINNFVDHNQAIQDKLGSQTWDKLTDDDKVKILTDSTIKADDLAELVKQQSKVQKAIDETNKKYEQQKRRVEELRGVLTADKADEWRLNDLQQRYQIEKSADEYGDPFLDRQYQREQIEIYTRMLDRQQTELDVANMLSDIRKKSIKQNIEQTQAAITSLEAQRNAGLNVSSQLDEQIAKLQELETQYQALEEYGTSAQIRARDAVRKTTIAINELKQSLDFSKRREAIDTTRLAKLKLDFDVESSASPFSDQEATIEYTHQRLNFLNQMREDYQGRLIAEQEKREVRKTSINTQIDSVNKNISNLTERQQSGEDVTTELQAQLQTLRDLNLEYYELDTIGTKAEQDLSDKIKNTTMQINELEQSLSSRKLWSRFEDRSLDRLKREYDVKQTGKIVDDGRDTKEYAREKMQILQQRRERLLSEYQIASQDGEMQRDRLLTQLDDTNARVVELEFRIQNGEEVQTELQTQKQLLDELNARWEDISLNGTDAERTIKQEMQETDIAIKETAQELDPVGTKLVEGLASGIQNFFSGILLQGESFKDAWKNLWSSIAQIALQQLIAMQLTKWGIGSWFGGSQGGSIPQKAHGGFVGFAEGGSLEEIDDLPSFAIGGNILNGGLIRGAGTATSDSILTYLAHRKQFIRTSNGEYIIQQKTVEKLGVPFLDMLNQNPEAIESLRKYAAGGYLGEEMIPEISQRGQDSYKRYVQSRAEVDNRGARQEKLLAEQNALLSRYSQPVNETTNMNINAVDSKSFVQLLARHSDVLIALLRKEQSRRNRY